MILVELTKKEIRVNSSNWNLWNNLNNVKQNNSKCYVTTWCHDTFVYKKLGNKISESRLTAFSLFAIMKLRDGSNG